MKGKNLQASFQQSTVMYQNDNYEACIALLNDCLILAPNIPMLYSNRGIAKFNLHQEFDAIADLNNSIQLDHLNYIAYFNLFSLNKLTNRSQQAFQSLCFSLSSIYTILGQKEKDLRASNRAIYYAYNNKEALAMHGLLNLQNNETEKSIKYLQLAFNCQIDEVNRRKMMSILSQLNLKLNRKTTYQDKKQISGLKYKLKTNLKYESNEQFEVKIDEMVKEFNLIYNHLQEIKENQLKFSFDEMSHIKNMTVDQEISILSSVKEDYQAAKLTTYNSFIGHLDSEQHFKGGYSFVAEENQKSQLNNKSNSAKECKTMNSSRQDLQEQKPTILINSVPQKSPSLKRIFINFKIYSATLIDKYLTCFEALYAVLKYNLNENQMYITPLSRGYMNVYQWEDMAQKLVVATKPSNLQIKLFNKAFNRFEDEFVARGETQIDNLGGLKIPLFDDKNCFVGTVLLGVELYQ